MAAFIFVGSHIWKCSTLPISCEITIPHSKRIVQTNNNFFHGCSQRLYSKCDILSGARNRKRSRNMGWFMAAAPIEMNERDEDDEKANVNRPYASPTDDAESTCANQNKDINSGQGAGEGEDVEDDKSDSADGNDDDACKRSDRNPMGELNENEVESREARVNEQQGSRSEEEQKEKNQDEDAGCSRAEQEERMRQKQQTESKWTAPKSGGNGNKGVPKREEKKVATAPWSGKTQEHTADNRSPRRGPGMSLRASSPLGAVDLWAPWLPFPFSKCCGSSRWSSGPYCWLDELDFLAPSYSISSYSNPWDYFSSRFPETRLHEDPSRKEYTLVIEGPGFDNDDIEVFVKHRTVYVRGGWNNEHGTELLGGRCRTLLSRRFSRSFKISNDVDVDRIHARVKHGIIYVHMPKEGMDHDNEKGDCGKKIDIQQD
mmetsp:Transcript_1757/g.3023  ORF Transcript_1757/g.3023 Transcript_1757/m.3023 type:complete len:430 (-) Transcript_1757:880-2169(-)